MQLEEEIGYSIIKGVYLSELVEKFEDMKASGICPNDKENSAGFWKKVRNAIPEQQEMFPCECAIL